ncbi:MAG: hypothetical protein ACHWZW_03110 [Spirulina sp.]
MKRAYWALIIVGGTIISAGVIRAVISYRNPTISLPLTAVRTAVDAVQAERDAEREAIAQAEEAFIYQSDLLVAHQAVRVAYDDWSALNEALLCARAQELSAKLHSWARQTSQPMEEVFQLEMAAHLKRVNQWNQTTSASIQGDAESIGKARAIILDTQALLYLGDLLYSREGLPLCSDSVARDVARLAQVFNEVTARVELRRDNLERLEAGQLAEAQRIWEGTDRSTDPAPAVPVAPAVSTPAAAARPGGLQRILYGGTE